MARVDIITACVGTLQLQKCECLFAGTNVLQLSVLFGELVSLKTFCCAQCENNLPLATRPGPQQLSLARLCSVYEEPAVMGLDFFY